MARASAISKLHAQPAPVGDSPTGRIKNDNLSHSPTATPPPERRPRTKRAQFLLTASQPEVASYTVSKAEIMATVGASVPVDRAADFAVLALRDRLAKRFGRRGRERWQGERGWAGIQA
jgi:hypothetical protein